MSTQPNKISAWWWILLVGFCAYLSLVSFTTGVKDAEREKEFQERMESFKHPKYSRPEEINASVYELLEDKK